MSEIAVTTLTNRFINFSPTVNDLQQFEVVIAVWTSGGTTYRRIYTKLQDNTLWFVNLVDK
jgi:hypothetical protein